MPPVDKIVFPVDFSERCDCAGRWVAAVARACDAAVVILHVVEPAQYLLGSLEFGATSLESFHAELVSESRTRLRQYLGSEFNGGHVRRVLVEGDPATKIVEFAHNEQANLIMMPSHGFGPFRRFILGSVTAKVLHDAHVPVWTGAHLEDTATPDRVSIRNLLCAVDLGPQTLAALTWSARIAERCGARLCAVHAVSGVESRPSRYMDAELSQVLRREARERLQSLLDEAGLDAQICLGAGDAAEVVRYAAEQHRADLVIIGRGSAAAAHGGRLRTHAYSIIRQSPCPVVSV